MLVVQIKKKKFIEGEQKTCMATDFVLIRCIADYHACLVAMWILFLGNDKVFGCVTGDNDDSKCLRIISSNIIVRRVSLTVSAAQSS